MVNLDYTLIIAKGVDPSDMKSQRLELWKQPKDYDLGELLVSASDSHTLGKEYAEFVRQNPEYLPPTGSILELVSANEQYSKTWSKKVNDQEKMNFAIEATRLIFPQLTK